MLAYKTELKINNETIFLKIPNDFKGKSVEIIILETTNANLNIKNDKFSDNDIKSNEPNELQKILLNSPTWTDDEYNNFLENHKLLSKWIID